MVTNLLGNDPFIEPILNLLFKNSVLLQQSKGQLHIVSMCVSGSILKYWHTKSCQTNKFRHNFTRQCKLYHYKTVCQSNDESNEWRSRKNWIHQNHFVNRYSFPSGSVPSVLFNFFYFSETGFESIKSILKLCEENKIIMFEWTVFNLRMKTIDALSEWKRKRKRKNTFIIGIFFSFFRQLFVFIFKIFHSLALVGEGECVRQIDEIHFCNVKQVDTKHRKETLKRKKCEQKIPARKRDRARVLFIII